MKNIITRTSFLNSDFSKHSASAWRQENLVSVNALVTISPIYSEFMSEEKEKKKRLGDNCLAANKASAQAQNVGICVMPFDKGMGF